MSERKSRNPEDSSMRSKRNQESLFREIKPLIPDTQEAGIVRVETRKRSLMPRLSRAENDENREISPIFGFKRILDRLDPGARGLFFEYVKARDVVSIKRVIKNVGANLSELNDLCAKVTKDFFSDETDVDWEVVESLFGQSR